jgi:hypothetical protein
MQTRAAAKPIDYARAIAELVAMMPVERAAEVYDFARFLRAQSEQTPSAEENDDDWLNDSEEQMRAEDALWNAARARHRAKFDALAEGARDEIAAGATQPMFDEREELEIQ